MEDLIQQGQEWLEQERREHMAREVTYGREHSTATVPATPAATSLQSTDRSGVTVEQDMRDYIIAREDLPSFVDEPQNGDWIEDTVEGSTVRFRVSERGGMQAAEWADTPGDVYRIHTTKDQVLS